MNLAQQSKLSRAEVARALLPQVRAELEKRGALSTRYVYGLVNPDGSPSHSITQEDDGAWVTTKEKPTMYLPAKVERVLRAVGNKRFIVLIGGRGSAKSLSVGDIVLGRAHDWGEKTYCLREYQSSIRNSVHSLLKEEISRLELGGFDVKDKAIGHEGSDAFEFAGLSRNVDSIKSAHGFKLFWGEEAQSTSQDSLRALTPTARAKPNKGLPGEIGEALESQKVSMIFVANPGSSEDPFSKRFINPYLNSIEREGYYEDQLHLIVQMNYMDNPWFADSGLEEERAWDYENLPRALYDHIWLGKFNDSVDSALIMAEWFDACIDAHKRLGFEPNGAKIASHDPSDQGDDAKAYAMRHGSVVLRLEEKTDGNVNEGGHWAAGLAIQDGVDAYSWEGDGMGAGLAEQNSRDFEGKNVQLSVFVSGSGPDHPDSVYKPALKSPVANQRTNKQTFKNKRAQYSWELRDRIYRTYRAVVHGEYSDPDKMISFPADLPCLSKLRAETCRIPIKPNGNGMNELWDKQTLKTKFKIASPNIFDALKQTMRYIPPPSMEVTHIPRPIKPMGVR